MKTILKVETKYNENLADAQVLVVTLLSNINQNWDFIVDMDAYHTLRLNEDYLVTTQDDWLGTIVGIRFETVANAINLKATVLKPVPDDDQVEVLDEKEEDVENVDFPLTPTPWMVWADLKHIDPKMISPSPTLFAEEDAYNKFHENNVDSPLPLKNPYDDMLRRVLYKGNKKKKKK